MSTRSKTLVEKIFSEKLGRDVRAGESVLAEVDLIMSHDTTTPLAIESFKKLKKVTDGKLHTDKMVIVFDHVVPAPNPNAATLHRRIWEFIEQNGIRNVHYGEGISHQILPEKGYVVPGALIVGADSHTCTYGAFAALGVGMGSTDIAVAWATGGNWFRVPETIRVEISGALPDNVYTKDLTLEIVKQIGIQGAIYKAIEYEGEAVERMTIADRMTLANMAVEMGAKAGLIAADQVTLDYLNGRTKQPIRKLHPDDGAEYERVYHIDAGRLKPKIAVPHEVENVRDVEEVAGLKLDQIFIGTCTNGRLEDLEVAYRILQGQRIADGVRLIITPGSNEVYKEAMRRGYIEAFIDAGATVTNAGCGPCIGRHQGVLADGERCLATMNRNFQGRMGSPNSEIYLASPATAVTSALAGVITAPTVS
ncbi:MAG: 3-isopropylmalate dehydratase large subunit [Candidatus Bipolaricaulia bacterium]